MVLNSSKKRTKLNILSKEYSQDSEFGSGFLWRIEDTINCFRDLLTFRWQRSQQVSSSQRAEWSKIQGISNWNILYELPLTDRNMQARFYLNVVLKSWGSDIWVSSTSFQKSNIGWPQQPPTETGSKIQHDISWFYHFFPFQNIKIKLNSRTYMALMSSVVIFQAFKPLRPQWPL